MNAVNSKPTHDSKKKILVTGAGPAGASLAIRLAKLGHDVTIAEREIFPRHKLCGEFISPESIKHFHELGVSDKLLSKGGDRIQETIFYSLGGSNISVPSEWFSSATVGAIGLSRAAMDDAILRRAAECGVKVLEGTSVREAIVQGNHLKSLILNGHGNTLELDADLFVDATGRSRVVSKLAAKASGIKQDPVKRKWIGFKSHFRNIKMEPGRCEIYLFEGGYGGLNYVEDGNANHCFLMRASTVKKYGSNPEVVFREVVLQNKRAAVTLSDAESATEWIAVAIDEFGTKGRTPFKNLVSVGDAGAFIDPFTGSGMLMAFQSSKLLSRAIAGCPDFETAADRYATESKRKFKGRLRISSAIRTLSFSPKCAGLLINGLKVCTPARKAVAVATRKGF